MHKFFKISLLFSFLIIITSNSILTQRIDIERYELAQTEAQSKNYKVLALVADFVGDTYFIVKEKLESWGWNVSTAGVSNDISSCPRREPKEVIIDILISDVDETKISEFDCVFIPSGGHWQTLYYYKFALDLISLAYRKGMVISSLCIGIAVLAKANIVNGVKIAYFSGASSYVTNAGGILTFERVVSDKRIVTGGAGGGVTGGPTEAPTTELCEALNTTIKETIESRNLNFDNLILIGVILGSTGSLVIITIVVFFIYKNRKKIKDIK